MTQDRLIRASAIVAGLRQRLQHEDVRQNLPWSYVEEFHRAIDSLGPEVLGMGVAVAAPAEGSELADFKLALTDRGPDGVERGLLLAKLDAACDYLSTSAARGGQQTTLAMKGYSLSELAAGRSTGGDLDAQPQVTQPKGAADSSGRSPAAEQWSGIAEEVLWRKRLLMAAAQELRDRQIPNDFTLATVDVFVEKAQRELTTRAEQYRWWGSATAVGAFALMILAALVLFVPIVLGFLSPPKEVAQPHLLAVGQRTDWGAVVVSLVRYSTLGAFVVGAIMYLVFISRALLHEMVVLYQRRHALRFGRLFIYLHPDKISVTELQAAFNWNAEYRSAFKDIRAEKLVQLPAGRTVEFAAELAEMVRELAKQGPKKE